MRSMVIAATLLSFVLPLAVPADAQTRLPRTTPAERKVKAINRNLQQEDRLRGFEQQIQIETNQLRQRIDRQRVFSDPRPVGRIGGCPRGAIGCY